MPERSLFYYLDQWWQHRRQPDRAETSYDPRPARRWLPTPGNAIFTLALVFILLWAQNVGALNLGAPAVGTSTSTIAYQGRLADSEGAPLTETLNMSFRLYTQANGGIAQWTEQWTGSNGVQVSDGLFNVMLGSLDPIPQNIITGNDTLFLGITVGTDDEMSPRVQLGSVPFAVQALTVPDGSITADKLNLAHGTRCLSQTEKITHDGGGVWVKLPIPGLQLDFTLEKPAIVMIWIDGLAYPNSGFDTETGVYLMLDNVEISGTHATLDQVWFNLSDQRIEPLESGTHTIDARVLIRYPGSMIVHPASSDGGAPWQTCINYLVLGQP
ncbi:MAG: hypothetical protein KBG20_15810 [Caldilineaceae bacterium]|nr:hypothetical protein [Caldilineaceae bacterium]MBP8124983.1 hypothetical protein [Caldilineaceae bacterium]MBP9073773.1 hypothetical protein [Caldilineaceae bacterium]